MSLQVVKCDAGDIFEKKEEAIAPQPEIEPESTAKPEREPEPEPDREPESEESDEVTSKSAPTDEEPQPGPETAVQEPESAEKELVVHDEGKADGEAKAEAVLNRETIFYLKEV